MLAGDVDAGKAVLRDDINATIGLEKLATATGKPKGLKRTFSLSDHLNARNLLGVLGEPSP